MTVAIEPTLEADFVFGHDEPFALSGGGSLQPVTLRFAQYGELRGARDNVILVCHALSGSARAAEWWPEMFGPGKAFDLERSCVLCANVIGSCYGSTGPSSINPRTGKPYAVDFPVVSIWDMVRAQAKLIEHLGIRRLHAVVGGSIGGMQALAWATMYPDRLRDCVAVGASPLSAMGLALSHMQRQAIRNDPAWRDGHYGPDNPPRSGLALARAIAMCSYKSAELFHERFGRKPNRVGEHPSRALSGRFDVGGYLDHQGEIFNRRFDANSYLVISQAMDTFELAPNVEEEREVLKRIQARVFLVGITSDWLFPPGDVRALAELMRAARVRVRHAELVSAHGHDGFLANGDQLEPLVAAALREDW
jgi:homoserine O-acetyltransferase/O-succinyltransferase